MTIKMQNLLNKFVLLVLFFGCSEALNGILPYPKDCTQLYKESPQLLSGVYPIQPTGATKLIMAYCEMRPDGGWTVFQRRSRGLQTFDKTWRDYKDGFGDLSGDHWLGLETVYLVTSEQSKKFTMRVDLWDHEGGTAYAEYADFSLGSEKTNYKLQVGRYKGNAGDAIRGAPPDVSQNGYGFSTKDRDNDGCSPCIFGDIGVNSCSQRMGGGWWYSKCGSAALNGDYHPAGNNIGWASGVHWLTWKGPAPYSAKGSRMMIKSM